MALVSGKRRFCPQKEPRKSSKSSAHTMAPASCLLFRYCTWWRRSRADRLGSLGEAWGECALGPFPRGPAYTQAPLWPAMVGGCGFRETYLVFDTLLVVIPHPLVALGSIGNLLAKDSVHFSSFEEITDLSREQDRGWRGRLVRSQEVTLLCR